jgi:DNA repair protein RecO (recombination protein O)
MAASVSESITLRSYPFGEADLIVSFFTRDQGKLRGVAKRARKPKSSFGSGLQRLAHSRLTYYAKPNRELTTLNGCELISSPFALSGDYPSGVALDFVAEVSDQILPPAQPDERFFRLILAVVSHLEPGSASRARRAATYFAYWAVRLGGFLPPISVKPDSARIAQDMVRTPVATLEPAEWEASTARDLRRSLVRVIEEHIERRLSTAPLLESL